MFAIVLVNTQFEIFTSKTEKKNRFMKIIEFGIDCTKNK